MELFPYAVYKQDEKKFCIFSRQNSRVLSDKLLLKFDTN